MSFRDLLALVLDNLIKTKFRTFLTMAGVVIGCIAVVLLVSLGAGLQRTATADFMKNFGEVANLTVWPSDGGMMFGPGPPAEATQPRIKVYLNDETVDLFKRIDGVAAVVPFVEVQANNFKYKNIDFFANGLVGVDIRKLELLGLKLGKGKMPSSGKDVILGGQLFKQVKSAIPKDKKIDLLGKKVPLFIEENQGSDMSPGAEYVANEKDQSAKRKKVKVRIAGVFKEKGFGEDEHKMFASESFVRSLQSSDAKRSKNKFSKVIVRAASIDEVEKIEKALKKQGFTNVMSIKEMLKGMQTFFLIFQAVLGGLGSIALFVASFGIANTMTMAIYERTKEIGIMKAIGASNKDIMTIFLAESAIVGALGGIIGAFFGFLGGKVINFAILVYLGERAKDFQDIIYTPFWLILFVLIFATFVGLISGMMPAMRAAKLSPLNALRHE